MTTKIEKITKIHVIFKTHLDVGFTNFAARVVENYFTYYIPSALELAKKLRLANHPERFIWTTGSWLIFDYLERANPAQRASMEEAILAGDIAWHGLPFTTHSELMDASLFRYGHSLSHTLDIRFGKHTIAAKMSDVPGHTRAIVPLLAEAEITFLHIGVNGASTPPRCSTSICLEESFRRRGDRDGSQGILWGFNARAWIIRRNRFCPYR